MKENGFPTREYSLRRPFQDPVTDAVVMRRMSLPKVMIGKKYPKIFSITKCLLLVTLGITLSWTLMQIPLMENELRRNHQIPHDTVKELKEIAPISRIITIIMCCFGIFGVFMQSFSLTLVFAVFTACRLVAILLVPTLKGIVVSVTLFLILSLLSLVFLFLVRRTDVQLSVESVKRQQPDDA
jgi:hypothetical protein